MRDHRRRDFEARAAHEPDFAIALEAGGEIVTIHPLADEFELLAKLGIRPEQCTEVDGYWSVRGDVVFLRVSTASHDRFRESGLYARVAPCPPSHVNLVVVVDVPLITRAVLEDGARELLRVGWEHVVLTDVLVRLS